MENTFSKAKIASIILILFIVFIAIIIGKNLNYPQFLSSKDNQELELIKNQSKNLKAINLGEVIDHNSNALIYLGWSSAEPTHRWSVGKASRLVFKVDAHQKFEGVLKLRVGTLGSQKITISLNETQIYSGVVDAGDKVLDIPINRTLLVSGEDTNTLAFELPDARLPGNGDPRILALALKSFQIR